MLIKILQGEFVRQIREMKRYSFQTIFSMLFLNIIFLGIFYGLKSFSPDIESSSLTNLIVGYCVWLMISTAYSTSSRDIAHEDETGTLEQVFLANASILRVLLIRLLVALVLGLVMTAIILFWTMLVTSKWVSIPLEAVAILLLSLPSAMGIGLLMGGFALYFKRIMPLIAALNFSMIGAIAMSAHGWSWKVLVPLTHGSTLIYDIVNGRINVFPLDQLLMIILNSGIYFALGIFVFSKFQKISIERGLLGKH